MSSAPTASLIVLLTLAAVLGVSAVAKLRDPQAFEDGFVSLRVPSLVPRRAASRAVPWVEAALAALLLLSSGPRLAVAASLAVALMAVYTWLVARALTFDAPVDCACFGTLGSDAVGPVTLARNVLLLGLSLVAVGVGASGGSAPDAVTDLVASDWWTFGAVVATVGVALTIVGRPVEKPTPAEERELDYERRPIPYGVLAMPDGTTTTLAELAATQARLLVVLNPRCGPCVRTAEKLDAWADRLGPAVGIVAVHPEVGLDLPHGEVLTAVEPAHNVRRVFSVGAPGAVLLGADGLMAGGPVAGEDAVEAFVHEIMLELRSAPQDHREAVSEASSDDAGRVGG